DRAGAGKSKRGAAVDGDLGRGREIAAGAHDQRPAGRQCAGSRAADGDCTRRDVRSGEGCRSSSDFQDAGSAAATGGASDSDISAPGKVLVQSADLVSEDSSADRAAAERARSGQCADEIGGSGGAEIANLIEVNVR